MTVLRTYARTWSTDPDAPVHLFEAATGHREQFRFAFGDMEIALIDDLQITAGPDEATARFKEVTATLVVDDLDATPAAATAAGGTITFGPDTGPVARYAMIRGGDGTHVGYAEWTDPNLRAALLPRDPR